MKNLHRYIAFLLSLCLITAFQIVTGYFFYDSLGKALFIGTVFFLIWNPIQYTMKQSNNKKKETP